MADWDLQAVVRGCRSSNLSSSAPTTTTTTGAATEIDPLAFFTQTLLQEEEEDDHLPYFPDLIATQTCMQELEALCRPFYHKTPQPISPKTHSIISNPPISAFNEQQQQLQQQQQKKTAHSSSNTQISRSKRRKNQQKRVVCEVPAEGLSSDMWAWRKYGQKPIKGSPYPRGYYRCSSSKGCSARKQVERSRNDPNMLVITYTSEHNHPWPTQRNALAGSTRTQPLKKDAAAKNSPITPIPKRTNSKEEPKKIEIHKDNRLTVALGGSSSTTPGSVKEEIEKTEKPMMGTTDRKFDQDFSHQSYGPVQLDSNQSDDFFADLGELEPDSLGIMFSEGFTGGKLEEDRGNKPMDPFSSLFACSGNSFGEAGKGL